MTINRDFLFLHFIVLIWGFTAILGLLITIPPVEMVFYRTLFAAIGLGGFIYFKGKDPILRRNEMLKLLGVGFLIAAHWILFFASARVSNASISLAGMSTGTFFTALLEPWFYRRKVRGLEIFLGLAVMIGLYFIFRFEFNHALGLLMSLLSAFLAALFTVINSKLTKNNDAIVMSFYEMSGATISTALFFPLYVILFQPGGLQLSLNGSDLFYMLSLSWVCTVFAYTASISLMKRISAFNVNLAVNMEPVYGIILAYLILGDSERMHTGFYAGTLIILISVVSYPMLNSYIARRKERRPGIIS